MRKSEKSQRTDGTEPAEGETAVSRRAFLRGTGASSTIIAGINPQLVTRSWTEPPADQGTPTPWLQVDGNRVKDSGGNTVILRGVSIADPKRVSETVATRGKTVEQVIDLATNAAKNWYARVIKLPVQPSDVGGHSYQSVPSPVAFSRDDLLRYLENHLDPVVEQCRQAGVYCIVDYHRHQFEDYTDPALDEEIRLFWDTVAPRYADQSHVLFEMYNEPIRPNSGWTPTEEIWSTWKTTAQPWVDLIRDHAPQNLLLIGSPFASLNPQGAVLYEEFDGQNLMYTFTMFPGHKHDSPSDYDSVLANAWKDVPIFVTEWGYEPNSEHDLLAGTTDGFGETARRWLSTRPVHWAAWCFDTLWRPTMFSQRDASPGEWVLLDGQHQGQFIKDFLAEYRNEDVPTRH